jgi:hypothetical protein
MGAVTIVSTLISIFVSSLMVYLRKNHKEKGVSQIFLDGFFTRLLY